MPVIYQGKQIAAEMPNCPSCEGTNVVFVTAGGTKAKYKCQTLGCLHVWEEDIEVPEEA